jgi:hypothetical protein
MNILTRKTAFGVALLLCIALATLPFSMLAIFTLALNLNPMIGGFGATILEVTLLLLVAYLFKIFLSILIRCIEVIEPVSISTTAGGERDD